MRIFIGIDLIEAGLHKKPGYEDFMQGTGWGVRVVEVGKRKNEKKVNNVNITQRSCVHASTIFEEPGL